MTLRFKIDIDKMKNDLNAKIRPDIQNVRKLLSGQTHKQKGPKSLRPRFHGQYKVALVHLEWYCTVDW